MSGSGFILQPCGDVICTRCDEVVHSSPETTPLDEVLLASAVHRCKPKCGAQYHDPYQGTWTCRDRPGHSGEHEDNDGHWWPTNDQLATW